MLSSLTFLAGGVDVVNHLRAQTLEMSQTSQMVKLKTQVQGEEKAYGTMNLETHHRILAVRHGVSVAMIKATHSATIKEFLTGPAKGAKTKKKKWWRWTFSKGGKG